MTLQPNLFDAARGEQLKTEGMAAAGGQASESWMHEAREVAVRVARERGTISADDVRAAGVETPPGISVNVWGRLFAGDGRFEPVDFTRSQRPEAHRNLLRTWRLKA